MDQYYMFTHIDFCFRTRREYAEKSNYPKGYWFITEIIPNHGATIWRKRIDGYWLRVATQENNHDMEAVHLGNLIKYDNGKALAEGQLQKRLDDILLEHMKKENKNEYPYYYWGQNRSIYDR